MENIATKKSSYDLLSSLYKARGKSGASSRNVRAQRASENRQLSRMDAVSKRRRMPLSPLADENVDNGAVTAEKNGKHVYANSQQHLTVQKLNDSFKRLYDNFMLC